MGEKLDEIGWDGVDALAALHSWDCIQKSPSVYVSRLDESPVKLSHDAATSGSLSESTYNRHFDLLIGTLGSGKNLDSLSNPIGKQYPSQEEALLRYGPLAFLPVILPTTHMRSFQNSFETEIRAEVGYDSLKTDEPLDYVDEIIKIFKHGTARKREDYKARLAPDMKFEEWRVHWRNAVKKLPELSKPGPKSALNNS